eukprot:5347890-Heterocapsa_arctica.AAC.1
MQRGVRGRLVRIRSRGVNVAATTPRLMWVLGDPEFSTEEDFDPHLETRSRRSTGAGGDNNISSWA